MSRKLVVNNQDVRIHYEGEWSLINSSIFQDLGTTGPPLESSFHMTTSNSSFAFAFNGTFIDVLGLVINAPTTSPVKLKCSVDGVNIAPAVSMEENNAHLCTSTFAGGSHELVVNISAQGSQFFLDNLQYGSSDNALFDNATVIIASTDSSISYSPGWSQLGGFTASMTEATNAFANISFIGNRIGWFGIIPGSETHHAPSPAEYSIDDGPLMNFTVKNSSSSSNIFNVPFFVSGTLEQGLHTLFVRYLGNSSTTPLTLNNLLVTNTSDPAFLALTTSSSSSTSTSSPAPVSATPSSTTQSDDKRGSTTGAVVGGVVGVVAGLALVAALLSLYRRRSKRSKPQAFSDAIRPSPVEHTYSFTPQARSLAPLMQLPNGVSTSQSSSSSTTTSSSIMIPRLFTN